MTTIRDLYEWAIEDGVADLPIGLKFQDGDEFYSDNTFTNKSVAAFRKNHIIN